MPTATYEAHATPPRTFAPPDTLRLAKRFCWKEAKRLAGVGAAVYVLAALVILVLPEIAPRADWLTGRLVIALGAAALMAVASVVTAFAVEREEGTAELLRILPRNRAAMLLGKLAGAALVVLAVALAGLLTAGLMNGWRLPDQGATILNQGALAIAEAFVFGLLASLVCPQPLLAAVIGMGLASLNSQVAIALWVPTSKGFTLTDYQEAAPLRLALLAAFALVNAGLGWRWLQGLSLPAIRRHAVATTAARKSYRRSWLVVFTRLCWQSFRQSWKTMLVAAVVGPFLTVCVVFLFATSKTPLAALAVLFTPALMGALVFRADQRGRSYRFMAEHAGRPRTAWLARQAVCLPIVLATPVMVVGTILAFFRFYYGPRLGGLLDLSLYVNALQYTHRLGDGVEERAFLFEALHEVNLARRLAVVASSAWLTAYAFGQLASLTIRSEILAGMAALFLSILLAAWSILMGMWRLDPLWTVAPLGIAALTAGYLRSRDWMFERSGLWRLVLPALLVVTPFALILPLIPGARLAQVSVNAVGVRTPYFGYFTRYPGGQITDLEQATRVKIDRGREVADAYERLAYADNLATDAWVEEVIELSKVDCRLPISYAPRGERWGVTDSVIRDLLPDWSFVDPISIHRLLAIRRIEQQMGCYYRPDCGSGVYALTRWARASERTSTEVKSAIAELRSAALSANSADVLAERAIRARSVIRGVAAPSFLHHGRAGNFAEWLACTLHEAPGESDRAEHALDILATQTLDWCYAMDALRDAATTSPELAQRFCDRLGWSYWLESSYPTLAVQSIIRATGLPHGFQRTNLEGGIRLVRQARTSLLVEQEWYHNKGFREAYANATLHSIRCKAERVLLALIAYRIDNDEYPESLDSLLGEYLSESELRTPVSGARFGYSRDGFDAPAYDAEHFRIVADEGTPLLWGSGEVVVRTKRLVYDQHGRFRCLAEESAASADETVREQELAFLTEDRYWNFWMPLPK